MAQGILKQQQQQQQGDAAAVAAATEAAPAAVQHTQSALPAAIAPAMALLVQQR